MELKLRVDWIRCDGYGLCSDLVPDLIDVDEWRYPILRAGPVPGDRLHEAQRAVDCCPMKALLLEPVSADRRGRAPGSPRPEGARVQAPSGRRRG